jgi:NAD+ diphosphatase
LFSQLDEEELEEARWFPREEIVSMLCRKHPHRLFVPPHQAIAHQVIKGWCLETAFNA